MKCSTCFRRLLRPSSGAHNCIYSIGYHVFIAPDFCICFLQFCFDVSVLLCFICLFGINKFHVHGSTNYPMLYIQFWAPSDGRRNCLKHVEHFTEINKLCNVASCWLHLKKIYLWCILCAKKNTDTEVGCLYTLYQVNLQAPCVLYITTGVSLLSRERFLYI